MLTRVILLALLAAGAVTESAYPEKQQRPPRYRVDVNLVTIDAVITDRKGDYPAGLQREDFEVYEDGQLQEIQDFRRVYAPQPSGTGPLPEEPAAANAAASISEPPRLFLLVIDNLNSQWSNLYQVAEAIENLISEKLMSRDLVAVMTVSHSAGLLQPFTNDKEALRLATRKALGLSLQGTMAAGAFAEAMRYAENAPALIESTCLYTGLPEELEIDAMAWKDAARIFAIQNDYSARGSLNTLQSVCKSLGEIKGRKTVIMISEGFGLSGPIESALPLVIDAANRSNVAIYTINPRGLEQIDPGHPVTFNNPPRATTFQSAGSVVAGNSAFDLVRMENRANSREDCLGELADDTGGITLRNSNEFRRGLERAINDGHSYYELTYIPRNARLDGKFRRVEVRLNSRLKGYSVRARRGYYAASAAISPALSVDEQMSRALYQADPPHEIQTALLPAVFLDPRGEGLARIVLNLRLGSENRQNGRAVQPEEFSLLAAIFDERGVLIQDFRQRYRLAADPASLQAALTAGATTAVDFRLPPGSYQAKAVLRESSSGRIGVERGDFEIPRLDGSRPQLSSILLSQEQAAVRTQVAPAAQSTEWDPMQLGELAMIPAARADFPNHGQLTVFFHVYNAAVPEDATESPYRYWLKLYREGELISRSDPSEVDRGAPRPLRGFALAPVLSLAALPAGQYRLEIEIGLPDGGERISRSASFSIHEAGPNPQR